MLTHLTRQKVAGCKTLTLLSLDFSYAADGISLTTQVSPRALGKIHDEQVTTWFTILDGYFENGGQHVNLNVMDLKDVYDKIMSGEDVIVRISGYCVNTRYLTPEQKTELTQRVFPRSTLYGRCFELINDSRTYKPFERRLEISIFFVFQTSSDCQLDDIFQRLYGIMVLLLYRKRTGNDRKVSGESAKDFNLAVDVIMLAGTLLLQSGSRLIDWKTP